jgi:hypothetical protein
MRCVCVAVLLLSAPGWQKQPLNQVPATKKEAKMPDKIDQAASGLQEFARSRDVDALERAVEALEEFDPWSLKPEQRLPGRRRLLLNWSRVLVAIDTIKEPGFDPDADRPRARVSPPDGFPPGADPKTIQDPRARAQYEAAIAANEKRKIRSRTQGVASELEQRAVESAHRVVDRWYTKSAADRKEIEAVFQEANLSAARRAEVLDPPPAPPPVPPPFPEDEE